ncbi:MAG: MotA/TolQ/ExbB proton channel family protein [Deltaproteobacteria bacterium]|nr:MotA/TolQ/ExbB proton channel family protein [Deltaproteobacteria bacterium]
MEYKVTFLDIMHQGGPLMWVLLGFSVIALAIIAEKSLTLAIARSRDRKFAARVRKALAEKESGATVWDLGLQELGAQEKGPLAAVAADSLSRPNLSRDEVDEAMTSAAHRELKRLRRGLGVLSTTANLAPLLGFLGTVTGMMISFGAISTAGLQDPGLVANGIKEALTTTAAGLTVAIPVQLAYNIFLGQLEDLADRLENTGELLLRTIRSEP